MTILVAAPAQAVEDPAESSYRAGVELRRKGDDAGALREFEKSYQLTHAPRALAQMALAEQALGRWVDAETHLNEALTTAARDPWILKNRGSLDTAMGMIADHLGSLVVEGAVNGAVLEVNGKRVGELPLQQPVRVPAGTAVLTIRAKGYLPVQRVTSITPATLTRESVDLVSQDTGSEPSAPHPAIHPPATATPVTTSAAPAVLVAAEPSPRPPVQRIAGWSAVALSGAALVTAVAFTAIHQSKLASYNRTDASGGYVCNHDASGVYGAPDCKSLFDGAATAKIVAVVGFAATAALGITGAVLLLTAPHADEARNHTAMLSCGMGPGSVGVACAGSF